MDRIGKNLGKTIEQGDRISSNQGPGGSTDQCLHAIVEFQPSLTVQLPHSSDGIPKTVKNVCHPATEILHSTVSIFLLFLIVTIVADATLYSSLSGN